MPSRRRRTSPGKPARASSCALVLATAALPAAHAEPFLVRNAHPLVANFGLPGPMPARLPAPGSMAAAGTFNWTSFAVTERTDDREFTLDGEVQELRLQATHPLGARFALHGELAWRRLDAGSLDGFIDDWHSALGLPDGSRGQLPADSLLLEYRVVDGPSWRVDSATSGIADIPVALGYQLVATETRALAAWLSVDAPTGRADDLTGNGAVDVALSLAGQARLHERWAVFGQLNATWLGQGDVLPALQKEHAWSALGGVTWHAWRSLDVTAQVEANSAVFDTGFDDLDGDAIVLTFGGSYVTQGGWRCDLGFVEDVQPDASPDITFNFGLRRAW
jgi:hypothetical protein